MNHPTPEPVRLATILFDRTPYGYAVKIGGLFNPPVKPKTVSAWKQRGRIPEWAIPTIAAFVGEVVHGG